MFVLGIAGGSGSGKSTLVHELFASLRASATQVDEHVLHLSHDSYYHDFAALPLLSNGLVNWDHPDALETDLFVNHIDELRQGRAVDVPIYDFRTHRRSSEVRRLASRPVLVIDGILLLALPEVRQRLDLKIFVDTPPDLRILRRLVRDVAERNRTFENVIEQYHASVRPMHDQFVEPSKQYADAIVPWELRNKPAVELLLARICHQISSQHQIA